MKKLIYCALALAAGLFATSCQQENLEPVQGGNTVTFTVEIPEVATKAIGDAENVDNLVYAVYRVTGENEADAKANLTPEKFVYQDHNSVLNGKSTVSLELINDQAYLILFWAQVGNTWFENEYQFGTEKVTYPSGLVANNDKYSAFYGVSYIDDVKGPATKDITLHRPFAQINVATNDPENYNVVINETSVTVTNAASGFDVAKEEAIVTPDYSVSFEAAQMPENEKLTVNNVTYETGVQNTGSKENDKHHYVAMNYVFAAGNVNVSYVIDTDHGTVSNTINNVPVAKNYRTNIVGGLLTSNVKYNIEIDQDWGPAGDVDDDNNISVWDGKTIAAPNYNDETKTYTIKTADELAWFAAAVNGTLPETKAVAADPFEGVTFVLAADINLNGFAWSPIGTSANFFQGTFDGANHTISNFHINQEGHAGLFGKVYGAISNLTVKNVHIVANHYAGGIVGQGYVNMENCHVDNINITLSTKDNDWGDKAGGIIGQNCEGAKYIKNSSAKNVTIKGYRDLGGIAGMAHYDNIVSGCSVENITITQDLTVNYESETPTTIGAVVGRQGSNVTFENNTVGNGIVINKLASNDETFAELLTKGGNIVLKKGEYTLPAGNIYPGEVNVTAAEDADVTINLPMSTYIPGTSLRLENITFKVPSGLDYVESKFAFIHHAKMFNMNNCIIDGGRLRLNVNEANINKCVFRCDTKSGFDGYGLYYYGMDNSTVNVSNSTFTTLGKAIVLYNEGPVVLNLNVDECTFTSLDETTDKTAIQMHSEYGISGNVNISNSTATGFAGINGGLWYDVNNNTKEPNTNFNITVDGHGVVRVGYTKLANYPNIWVKDNNYYVFDKAGLAELNNFFKANSIANHVWTRSYNIGADIDATGFTWDCVYMVVGSNDLNGLVLNGNGSTISNLTIDGGGLFTGTPKGANEGTTSGYVKNITIVNAAVTGDHNASVFWANAHGEIVYENVVVKNTSVTGNCNVGVFIGATTIDSPTSKIDPILFKNCAVENCTIVANGKNGQDPTGASGFVGRAFGKTSLKFEGTNTIDEATTITNNKGLVGGRVYGYTTWYGNGFTGTGACDTFTDFAGVEVVKVGDNVYGSFAAAVANAKTGDKIELLSDVTLAEETMIPAGVTLKGNGNQINGSIYAGGDLTFEGHTKVTSFSASYYNRTITISEGACLQVTGDGRVSLAYGNTFNIIGSIEDAKTVDKANIQPSLILPGGLSITGGNDAVMSFTNAYVQIGSTSSKNSAANGTFTLNIENSIAEFTDQLTFAEPTSGKNPTFNLNVKNSVLTTATKLCIAAPNTNVVIDNSKVTLGSYLRNSGKLTIKNGSSLTGKTIQFGENGGNNGTINIDASTLKIVAGSTGNAFDGKGTGKIDATNGATVSVDYYKDMTINTDGTSTFTGTEVQ